MGLELKDILQDIDVNSNDIDIDCQARNILLENFAKVQVNFEMAGKIVSEYHKRIGILEAGLEINDRKTDTILERQDDIGKEVHKISKTINDKRTLVLDHGLKLVYALVLLLAGWLLYGKLDTNAKTQSAIIHQVLKEVKKK